MKFLVLATCLSVSVSLPQYPSNGLLENIVATVAGTRQHALNTKYPYVPASTTDVIAAVEAGVIASMKPLVKYPGGDEALADIVGEVSAAVTKVYTDQPDAPTSEIIAAVGDGVTAGIKTATRKHGFRGVSEAPLSDINTAIKAGTFASLKTLIPNEDDEALATINNAVAASILSGLRQRTNAPTDVVTAAIEDGVLNAVDTIKAKYYNAASNVAPAATVDNTPAIIASTRQNVLNNKFSYTPGIHTTNFGYTAKPLSVNYPSNLKLVPNYNSGLVYSKIPTYGYTYPYVY